MCTHVHTLIFKISPAIKLPVKIPVLDSSKKKASWIFFTLCAIPLGQLLNCVITEIDPFVVFPMVSKAMLWPFIHCKAAQGVACPSRHTLHDKGVCL